MSFLNIAGVLISQGHYPHFYLNHCCGFDGKVDIFLDLPDDERTQNHRMPIMFCYP